MASGNYPPPPTFTSPVIVNPVSGENQFSPIWLQWFLELAQLLSEASGSSGTIQHNSLAGLQGGNSTTSEYYHLTSAEASVVSGLTLPLPVASGGTGASTASAARANLGTAASGANSDITSLTGLTTPLAVAEGGTGATSAGGARTNLGLGTIATQNASAVTLTGGSMNGVTVGATTPEPGAFTTLTASSNVAFRAQNTSVQSIPTGTATQVTGWTLVSSRNAGGFNATAGTFTAPVAGWYLVSGQLVFAASSIPAGTLYGMWAVVNGVERQRGALISEVANTQGAIVKLPMVALPMAAGDVLTINAVQYSGAALTLDNYGPNQWLSVAQIP